MDNIIKVSEKCKDCPSCSPVYIDSGHYYCHAAVNDRETADSDISTIYVNLEERPDWCPFVKANKMYADLSDDKKKLFDKASEGLKAMFEMLR